jgi:uncharacterized protein (DUF1697 family)
MSLVVLLRGVNVGGHRTFRPKAFADALAHLDVVNIGAAGTFVVRRPVTRAKLRAELAGQLPFETEIVICEGREIVSLVSESPFEEDDAPPGVTRFLSVLAKTPVAAPVLPVQLPSGGPWLMRIVARQNRLVFGEYKRHMKVIGYLNGIDKLFGAPATTRNWNTVAAIAKVLEA